MDNISRYKKGGFKQLLSISIPLMISGLSGHIMMFVDRLILSHYSTLAMDSVAASGLVAYIFILAIISIASMSEIFVGQYNGAKQYKKTSAPVWQMIWFSIGSSIIIYPIAFLGGKFLIPESLWEDGLPYFYWIMCFIPLYGCSASLASFFAAIGRPKIISIAAIISNIVNFLLAIILIFGYKNIIPSLGAKGAAIASVGGISVQFFILILAYSSKDIRTKYDSLKITWNKSLFIQCIKIGYPSSIGHTLELLSWVCIFHIAGFGGEPFITVLTVGHNFLLLFVFLTEGMQKSAIAISSNLIGSGDGDKINNFLKSATILHLIIIIVLALPLVVFADKLIFLFDINHTSPLYEQCIISVFFVWVYFIFDGMIWTISGILTSAGDTKFIMITNSSCGWIFGVLPTLIAIQYFSIEPYYLWMNTALYCFINLIIFILRYKYGNWKKVILIENAL